jgi:hypothetical protein
LYDAVSYGIPPVGAPLSNQVEAGRVPSRENGKLGAGPVVGRGAVLAKVREMVLTLIERHRAIKAWIVDDTGIGCWSGSGSSGYYLLVAEY